MPYNPFWDELLKNDIHRYKGHIKKYLEEDAVDLYENAPCGYLSFATDGTIVKVNTTLLTWIGADREDLLYKKKFSHILTIGGKIFYETHFAPRLRMQNNINEINFDIVKAEGGTISVLVSCIPVKDDKGETVLYRATVFDITERKKYERELLLARKKAEEAAKAKANFISTVSHEIRTPMNAIIGISDLLLSNNPKQSQLENLQMLKQSSSHLLDLINDILDFSKIEAGKMKVEKRNCNLRALIESIAFSLKNKAEEKGIDIHTHWDKSLPDFFMADPVKISQIVTNLLGNAIKFTEQGYVEISVQKRSEKEGYFTLDFITKDTGAGIAPDRLDHIFEEFVQESYDTGIKFGGTGLGLSISQKLLELYNSQLKVKSEVGKGTEFYFDLQLKEGKAEKETGQALLGNQVSIKGINLLLVEDNRINVMVATQFLDSWGVEYDVAENGKQAVEMITQNDYDLVLMDLQMPVMNGYEATREIRNMPDKKYQELPIIALSATSEGELLNVENMGMNAYVTKPFTSEGLHSKIALFASVRQKVQPLSSDRAPQSKHADKPDNSKAVISLQFFQEIFGDNDQELLKIYQLLLRDFQHFLSVFPELLAENKRNDFEKEVHKLNAVFHQLKATGLLQMVEKMRNLLTEDGQREAVDKLSEKITHQLKAVIEIIEQEVQRLL